MRQKMTMLAAAMAIAAESATAQPLPPDLAAAAHAFDAAQVKGDRAALERLLANDYLLVNSKGNIENKANLIRDYTAPGFTLEPFTIERPVEKVWAAGAVLGGITTLSGMDRGKHYSARLRFADIWAKRGGRWQVIYTQVNKAPAEH